MEYFPIEPFFWFLIKKQTHDMGPTETRSFLPLGWSGFPKYENLGTQKEVGPKSPVISRVIITSFIGVKKTQFPIYKAHLVSSYFNLVILLMAEIRLTT